MREWLRVHDAWFPGDDPEMVEVAQSELWFLQDLAIEARNDRARLENKVRDLKAQLSMVSGELALSMSVSEIAPREPRRVDRTAG